MCAAKGACLPPISMVKLISVHAEAVLFPSNPRTWCRTDWTQRTKLSSADYALIDIMLEAKRKAIAGEKIDWSIVSAKWTERMWQKVVCSCSRIGRKSDKSLDYGSVQGCRASFPRVCMSKSTRLLLSSGCLCV